MRPCVWNGLELCGFVEIVPTCDWRSEKYTPWSVVLCAMFRVSLREYLFSVYVAGKSSPVTGPLVGAISVPVMTRSYAAKNQMRSFHA